MLLWCRLRVASRIADGKVKFDQVVRNSARVLRRRNLEIEVFQSASRIANVDEFRSAECLVSNVSRDRHAAITDAQHEIRPWRPDQLAGLLRENCEAVAQRGDPAKPIKGEGFGLEREAERFREREQLVVVAGPIVQEKPGQGSPRRRREWRSICVRGTGPRHEPPALLISRAIPIDAAGADRSTSS